MKEAADSGDYYRAWEFSKQEETIIYNSTGCDYYYGIDLCHEPPEELDYEDYSTLPETRKALHVGNRPFGHQGDLVFESMLEQDYFRSGMDNFEFLLDRYPVSHLQLMMIILPNQCIIFVDSPL